MVIKFCSVEMVVLLLILNILAAELICRFKKERRSLAGIALTTDTSALTAIANDYDFESVFARQVEGLGRTGDVSLGFLHLGTPRML